MGLALGHGAAAVVDAEGVVWEWGTVGHSFALGGEGPWERVERPRVVGGLPRVVAVSVGWHHIAAADESGVVWTR